MTDLPKIVARFPSFDVSYETVLHKNLPTDEHYTISVAIPFGKKYYIWYTYYEDKHACFIMELNRDRQIVRIVPHSIIEEFHPLFMGTILYVSGVLMDTTTIYFIEDIYYYEGLPISGFVFGEKLGYIEKLLLSNCPISIPLFLPNISTISSSEEKPIYPIHHIQFRSLTKKMPFLNQGSEKKIDVVKIPTQYVSTFRPCFKKPQYRENTVFLVRADIQFDIYHLYAYNGKKADKYEYYDVAYIPNYPCSVFMNCLFRNIRENNNIDWIEESDDEDDFQNTSEDKYVNVEKKLAIECSFHPIFKKWIPIRVVKQRIVSVDRL
jgi:hypothetical protein